MIFVWWFCDFSCDFSVIFVCDFLWFWGRCTKKNQWFAPRYQEGNVFEPCTTRLESKMACCPIKLINQMRIKMMPMVLACVNLVMIVMKQLYSQRQVTHEGFLARCYRWVTGRHYCYYYYLLLPSTWGDLVNAAEQNTHFTTTLDCVARSVPFVLPTERRGANSLRTGFTVLRRKEGRGSVG